MERIIEPDIIQLEFYKKIKALTLVSSSPNRKALLEKAGCSVKVFVPDIDEQRIGKHEDEILSGIASRKLDAYLSSKCFDSKSIAIASDTMVLFNSTLLGKPQDLGDSERMLKLLSGKRQTVISAVSMYIPGQGRINLIDKADVIFKPLSHTDISNYIKTGESIGAAGAYRLQKTGYTLVERIDGDWTCVVGLPLKAIIRALA